MANDANAAFILRDQEHLIHPLHSPAAHVGGKVWVRGEGAELIDANGDRYIDGLSGLWNNTAGHGCRELVDAAATQMAELPYASGYSGSTNPRAIELAERLAAITYPNINRFYFTSGGGESSDSNFKMARYYWKLRGKPDKTKVISRQWGYHGVTLAAMSATGITAYWPMFEPRVPGFVHIPSPYPYRYEAPAGESQGIAAANELEQAILREGPDTVGMFIAEPVQGAGGVIVPQDDYFPRIREICDQYDVLFASDEGDHRLRPHRTDVRPRALGGEAGHDPVREGDHVGLLPARRHRDQRRDRGRHGRREHPMDARLHVQRPPGRMRHRRRDARHHRAGRLSGDGRGQGQAAAGPSQGRARGSPPRRRGPRPRPDVRRRVRPRPGHQGGVRRGGERGRAASTRRP